MKRLTVNNAISPLEQLEVRLSVQVGTLENRGKRSARFRSSSTDRKKFNPCSSLMRRARNMPRMGRGAKTCSTNAVKETSWTIERIRVRIKERVGDGPTHLACGKPEPFQAPRGRREHPGSCLKNVFR
eukprot:scaffold649_cov347-Pavlova_lutheri.AAC.79